MYFIYAELKGPRYTLQCSSCGAGWIPCTVISCYHTNYDKYIDTAVDPLSISSLCQHVVQNQHSENSEKWRHKQYALVVHASGS